MRELRLNAMRNQNGGFRTCSFAYDAFYVHRKSTKLRDHRWVISREITPTLISWTTNGSRRNMKNMASILAMSDIAVLVYDATKSIDNSRSYLNTMWDHLLMAFAFGIRNVIVAVNKMDEVGYSEETYNQIVSQLQPILKSYGWASRCISFIPVSANPRQDINIVRNDTVKVTQYMPWYKGPPLSEILHGIRLPLRRTKYCPFRMSIYDCYKIGGIGTVIVGRVESGTLREREQVLSIRIIDGADAGISMTTIEQEHTSLSVALPGNLIGVRVLAPVKQIQRGVIIGTIEDVTSVCEYFVAQIIVTHKQGIEVGYTPIIDCHQAHVPCRITEIRSIVDKKTGEVVLNNPRRVEHNKSAIVCFKPLKQLFIERYVDYPGLGRFIMRDGNFVSGMGVVKTVMRKINWEVQGIVRINALTDVLIILR